MARSARSCAGLTSGDWNARGSWLRVVYRALRCWRRSCRRGQSSRRKRSRRGITIRLLRAIKLWTKMIKKLKILIPMRIWTFSHRINSHRSLKRIKKMRIRSMNSKTLMTPNQRKLRRTMNKSLFPNLRYPSCVGRLET
jgi:hypothetical protein